MCECTWHGDYPAWSVEKGCPSSPTGASRLNMWITIAVADICTRSSDPLSFGGVGHLLTNRHHTSKLLKLSYQHPVAEALHQESYTLGR